MAAAACGWPRRMRTEPYVVYGGGAAVSILAGTLDETVFPVGNAKPDIRPPIGGRISLVIQMLISGRRKRRVPADGEPFRFGFAGPWRNLLFRTVRRRTKKGVTTCRTPF